jgi:hypothetical protein
MLYVWGDERTAYEILTEKSEGVKVKLSRYMPWRHMEGEEV